MGADGTLYVMKAQEFAEQWPGLVPQQCGLSERTILGIPALTAYVSTVGNDDFEYSIASKSDRLEHLRHQLQIIEKDGEGTPGDRVVHFKHQMYLRPIREAEVLKDIAALEADPEIGLAQRCAEAIRWYEEHAEQVTVWT